MTVAQIPKTLNVLAYNTHLFGRTGMIADRETGLIFQDEKRAEQIANRLQILQPDIVGLGEVWDDDLRRGIVTQLADLYPYRITTPARQGIQDIFDSLEQNWPRTSAKLFDHVEDVVDLFARSHYHVGTHFLISALCYLVKEDWAAWMLRRVFLVPEAWGSGLLMLSKHPLINPEFHLYPDVADLDRFTRKGVLKADVSLPEAGAATVFLTHLQEGESRRARRVRRKQERYLKNLVDQAQNPAIVLGDLNIRARDREYRHLSSHLDLTDSYLATHPDINEAPGYTYDHDTPFSVQLGVTGAPGQGQCRIDYVFTSRGIKAQSSRVLREEFRDEREGYDLSDHFPVAARVSVS